MENALLDTLTATVNVLDELGVPYAITGSVASSVYGEPVVSQDVDLILQTTPEKARMIARQLQPRFYCEENMLAEAASRSSLINIIDNRTSLKVDLSFVPNTAFFRDILARRLETRIGSDSPGLQFVSPEDVVLMKLLWRRDTQSRKQWENALSVVRGKGISLDWKYLFEQARTLGLEEDLIKLRDEAGI